MSESPDLAAALLEADPAERERLLRCADPAMLEAAIGTLGHQRAAAAADVLATVERVIEDRVLRKAARRELHRLRSIGIAASAPAPVAAAAVPAHADTRVPISQAWATDIDPTGSRGLWLLAERPLGGVWFSALVLNDQRGVPELSLVDTTRKRFQKEFDESRASAGTWVDLPGEYALALVREAVDIAREQGGLPARYHAFRDVFGEAPSAPERALVYETISPVEASFNPDWLADSTQLVSEREIAGWHVPVSAELRARALEVARGPMTGLLVPGHTPEQNALQLVAEAAQQAASPTVRRRLRRRLEETAYIFLQTDRLLAARRAVGAARALEDDKLPAERHPLLRLLLASGLARLLGGETVGSHRAAEVLIELIERAGQASASNSAVETRPSGLILPR